MLNIFQQEENESQLTHHVTVGSFAFPVHHSVRELLVLLNENDTVLWVSKAEWSAIDLLAAVLARHEEPAVIWISSYAFSEKPARILANLMDEGKIAALYCLIDSRVDVRSQPALQLLQGCATLIKLVDTHAKVTVVKMGEHYYTIVGSANYTSNKRYEAGMISRCANTAAFQQEWIKEVLYAAEQ